MSMMKLHAGTGESNGLAKLTGSESDAALERLSPIVTEPAATLLESTHPFLAARRLRAQALRMLNAGKSKYYGAAIDNLERARDCNRQDWQWRDEVAHLRRWAGDDSRRVSDVFLEEQPRLLPPPLHTFPTDRVETVCSRKTIYVRFDLNDYSIPPEAVGRPLTLAAADTAVRFSTAPPRSPVIPVAMTGIKRCSIRPTGPPY